MIIISCYLKDIQQEHLFLNNDEIQQFVSEKGKHWGENVKGLKDFIEKWKGMKILRQVQGSEKYFWYTYWCLPFIRRSSIKWALFVMNWGIWEKTIFLLQALWRSETKIQSFVHLISSKRMFNRVAKINDKAIFGPWFNYPILL